MGLPMATNLLKSGHYLRVFNRTTAKAEPLVSLGAELVSTPKEVAQGSDIVISIVSRTEDVREVLLGDMGVVHGASSGCLVVDMSTIDSVATQEIAAELNKREIEFLDAPVSGGETGAKNASLTIFCGGSKNNVERATPVFEAMGKSINHMGPCGSGQVAKSCNQIIVSGTLMGVAEALAFGSARGLDLQALIEATSGGAAQSWQLENLGPLIAKQDYSPGFMVDLFHKDLSMVLADAASKNQKTPITELFVNKLEELQELGDGRFGSQAVYKRFRFDE